MAEVPGDTWRTTTAQKPRGAMRVYIFRSGDTYGLTGLADGSNLPLENRRWEIQAEVTLLDGESPFGIDARQALLDIGEAGYHLVSVSDMLRRSLF